MWRKILKQVDFYNQTLCEIIFIRERDSVEDDFLNRNVGHATPLLKVLIVYPS